MQWDALPAVAGAPSGEFLDTFCGQKVSRPAGMEAKEPCRGERRKALRAKAKRKASCIATIKLTFLYFRYPTKQPLSKAN